jgi:DNA-binding GntR family transcriptional regulator
MPSRPLISRTAAPLRQQVVQLIREEILQGNLKPGQRLVENALCQAYDVSRTVIREALRQLETEHLINVVPNAGPIVAVLSEEDIKAIYVVRCNLEGLAGRLFALNASKGQCSKLIRLGARLDKEYRHGTVLSREFIKAEFYQLLVEGAGNPILAETLELIHARIAIFRRYAFEDESRTEPSIAELEAIIQAAAVDRDADTADRACQHHIMLAADLAVKEYVSRNPEVVEA